MRKHSFNLIACLFLLIPSTSQAFSFCCDFLENGWFNMEYLYGKIQDAPAVIPLVVQGPEVANGSPVLGQPGTKVILGDKKIDHEWISGGRFTFGSWFDDCHTKGMYVNYFFLNKISHKHTVSSDGSVGSNFLSVPYINTNTEQESSLTLANPGVFSGTATLRMSSMLQGAEINGMIPYSLFYNEDIKFFLGIRYLNLAERLSFNTSSPEIDPTLDNVYSTKDSFRIQNNFYGGQLGFDWKANYNSFFFNLIGKVALGALNQFSHIQGSFTLNDFTDFTTAQRYEGGYFALKSNIGHHRHTRFSVVPEINVNFGYELVEGLFLSVGYNFLYVTNVIRAANQIDRRLNPTQSSLYEFLPEPSLEGEALPKGSLKSSNLWMQGLNVGLAYTF